MAAAIGQLCRRCVHISAGVTDSGFYKQAVLTTIHELGAIDVLVDNPAVQQHTISVDELSFNEWEQAFKADIHACFDLIREALPHFRERSSSVTTGSTTGIQAGWHLVGQSATRGAIHVFTERLVQQLAVLKISVTCAAPGTVRTAEHR